MMSGRQPEICVIGRCDFEVGIGAITEAFGELLARQFPVCMLPTEPHLRHANQIIFPSGRAIPVCRDVDAVKVAIFADVIWNGVNDYNYALVPQGCLRYACVVWDSDILPSRVVEILNSCFDAVLITSSHLRQVLTDSGVVTPIVFLPLALPLESLLATDFIKPRNAMIRFGSMASFHPRKGHDLLVDCFMEEFGNQRGVELIIHSNLSFIDHYQKIFARVGRSGVDNVHLTCHSLTRAQKTEQLSAFDVYCSASFGEGYSIGVREALALGKVAVISDVGGHKDLAGTPGLFQVPAQNAIPARFPEIDNLVFGRQFKPSRRDFRKALRSAYDLVRSPNYLHGVAKRRQVGARFSFTRLADAYGALISPWTAEHVRSGWHPPEIKQIAPQIEKWAGRAAAKLDHPSRRVVVGHDGGYFSVFNVFVSHLVWDLQDQSIQLVLPDWDVRRMMAFRKRTEFTSFCYGKPSDGNIWLKLYEPLFGLSDEDMNDPKFLYRNATVPEFIFNEKREPQLTYIHAYKLYQSREFAAWRRQYHAVYRRHVKLRQEHKAGIDAFVAKNFGDKYMIAAHVRHPSHIIEQPTAAMAFTESYIEQVRQRIKARPDVGNNWGVFLATDQERVIRHFQKEFGDKVCFFPDVKRTTIAEDEEYEAAAKAGFKGEGFQIQHRTASDPERWDTRMAVEVIRDCMALSRAHVLLHITSNISTAVSYMNPDVELVYCS